jgi:hypothetical protein
MGAGLVQPVAIREGKQAMVENAGNLEICEKVWREISNYVDGEVDAGQRSAMEEHFRICNRCASVLAGVKNVVALYGDERMMEVPAGFSRRLEKRLAKNVARGGWSTWSAWLVPIAAIVLIAGTVALTNSLTYRNYIKSLHAEPGKNIPPDLVVVVSAGSKLFHVPGCPFIHDKATERTMTAKEAIRDGYIPCTRCLRQYLQTGLVGPHADDDASAEAEEEQEVVLGAAGH